MASGCSCGEPETARKVVLVIGPVIISFYLPASVRAVTESTGSYHEKEVDSTSLTPTPNKVLAMINLVSNGHE